MPHRTASRRLVIGSRRRRAASLQRNRGCLHDEDGRIRRSFASKAGSRAGSSSRAGGARRSSSRAATPSSTSSTRRRRSRRAIVPARSAGARTTTASSRCSACGPTRSTSGCTRNGSRRRGSAPAAPGSGGGSSRRRLRARRRRALARPRGRAAAPLRAGRYDARRRRTDAEVEVITPPLLVDILRSGWLGAAALASERGDVARGEPCLTAWLDASELQAASAACGSRPKTSAPLPVLPPPQPGSPSSTPRARTARASDWPRRCGRQERRAARES